MTQNTTFTIFHEFSIEIAAPLHEVWESAQNPSNWIMWGTMYEACYLKGGQFKSGEVIKVKVKNKPRPFSLLLFDIQRTIENDAFYEPLHLDILSCGFLRRF